jgi:hypothetical protein
LNGSLTPEKGLPQGLKPLFRGASERAKPEGLAYLEATAEIRESPVSLEVAAGTREAPESAAVDPVRLDVGALAAESLYPPPLKVPKVFKGKTLSLDFLMGLSAEARPEMAGLLRLYP